MSDLSVFAESLVCFGGAKSSSSDVMLEEYSMEHLKDHPDLRNEKRSVTLIHFLNTELEILLGV